MNQKLNTKTIALSGMMAAIIFIATWVFKVPTGIGYVHLGDGFILIAASVLGWPAVLAAALGSMLADLLAGYTIYMLPTFIIKGAVAAIAVLGASKEHQTVKMLYMLIAEAVMIVGYFIAEWLILGYGWAAAAGSFMGNILQGLSGIAVWIILMPVIKRIQKQA